MHEQRICANVILGPCRMEAPLSPKYRHLLEHSPMTHTVPCGHLGHCQIKILIIKPILIREQGYVFNFTLMNLLYFAFPLGSSCLVYCSQMLVSIIFITDTLNLIFICTYLLILVTGAVTLINHYFTIWEDGCSFSSRVRWMK